MLPLKIRQQIMNHLESGDKDSGLPLAKLLISQFPKYSFSGIAHRSIMSLDPIENVTLHPGDSFTSDTKSIDQFFKDNRLDSYQDAKGIVVEAEITGFNLGAFIRNEMDLFPEVDQEDLEAYLGECEILSLDIIKVIQEYEYKP